MRFGNTLGLILLVQSLAFYLPGVSGIESHTRVQYGELTYCSKFNRSPCGVAAAFSMGSGGQSVGQTGVPQKVY